MSFVLRNATYSPGLRQARHSHEYSNITIVIAGTIEEATELGEYRAYPGSVVSKGAGCEHENRVGGYGARTLSIQFPGISPLRPNTWSWLDTPDVVRRAVAVQRATSQRDLELAATALIECVSPPPVPMPVPRWIDEIREVLDRNYEKPPCFEALARDFRMHPVYVARAFRRHTGMSMSEYVRAQRIGHARRALSSTRRSVGAIAAESGFADSSHFCRTFREAIGITPRRYRALTAKKVQPVPFRTSEPS